MNLRWATILLEIIVGNQRMIKVAFIGDEPSKKNAHQDLAFVGAGCFKTVISWIRDLDPDYYVCLNSNTDKDIEKISILYKEGFKLVALGEKASKRLNSLPHFKLPHPSGLNRLLNNRIFMNDTLNDCEDYIYG